MFLDVVDLVLLSALFFTQGIAIESLLVRGVAERHEFRVCINPMALSWQPYIGSANTFPDEILLSHFSLVTKHKL